jgi:hypothetical protein
MMVPVFVPRSGAAIAMRGAARNLRRTGVLG